MGRYHYEKETFMKRINQTPTIPKHYSLSMLLHDGAMYALTLCLILFLSANAYGMNPRDQNSDDMDDITQITPSSRSPFVPLSHEEIASRTPSRSGTPIRGIITPPTAGQMTPDRNIQTQDIFAAQDRGEISAEEALRLLRLLLQPGIPTPRSELENRNPFTNPN